MDQFSRRQRSGLDDIKAQITAEADQALAAALDSDESVQEIEDWLSTGMKIALRMKSSGVPKSHIVSMLTGAVASRFFSELK